MTHLDPSRERPGGFRRNRFSLWFLLACALFFISARAFAQEGTILGTVTDPTGAVVPNVAVTLTNLDTGLSTSVNTAADGQFVVPGLAAGHYTVKVTATGFKISERTGVVLNVADRLRLDFQLEIGGQTQTVTVAADQTHIQTDTGEISTVINSRQVEQLETNGRSIYTLVNLTPGASSIQPDYQAPTPVGGNANVSFNGQRMSHNIYLMDGGENLDRGGAGTFSVMPSLEAIQEFTILTSNYSPEYGLSSAATMNTVLKSGTKAFHGSAWEVNRNDALDARNYFNRSPAKIAKLRSNIFGANIGGPVSFHPNQSEPRTFFFYNQEWRRIIQGGTINQKVPPTSVYQGNFTGSAYTPAVPCASSLSAADQARFAGAGITKFSTTGTDGKCKYDVTFPDNKIPAALLDANAQALLTQGKIFPAPTSGEQFQGGSDSPTYVTEEIARVDRKFGDKFTIFGHWVSEQITQTYGTTMWSGDNVPTIGNTFGNPSYSAVVHTAYTINPSLLNEAAFNYNGNRIHILPKAAFGAPVSAPSSFTFNRIFNGPNPTNVMPTIALATTGTQYSANWTPWNNKADDYQIRDDVSWVRGAHQFKFGASWALYTKNQDAFAAPQGNFGFNGFYTNYDFADFLLGYANNYSEQAVHDSGTWNNISWAAYAADNWRATPRLTLNLGLRWDGVPHTYEVNKRASSFYPNLYDASKKATFDTAGNLCSGPTDPGCSAASPGLGQSPNSVLRNAGALFYLNGIGIGGVTPGVPRGLAANQWNVWGPRFGLSYDVTGRGKTVVRAGAGVMYERIQGNDMYNGATNPPFDATVNFSNVKLADPHTSVATGSTLTVPIVVTSMTGIDTSKYKLPVVYQYSGGIQQQFGGATLLSVSYVGSQSRHQNDWTEANLPPASALAGLINSGGTGYNQKVPYLGYQSIRQAENVGNGRYNSLQIDTHTVFHGLQAQFGYTLARAMDPTSGNGGNGWDLNNVSNPYAGWRYDWGPSPFDRTSVAFVNYIYEIPLFRNSGHLMNTLLGGWEVAGVSTFQTGAPTNVTLGGTAGANGLQGPTGINRPSVSGSIGYPKKLTSSGIQWFNPSAFTAPAIGQWGNLGHNAIRGPGRDNWNLAMHKIFSFNEHSNFEFRAEAFNVWNHTQWQGDAGVGGLNLNCGWNGTSCAGGNFGQITSAYDPRVFQLMGKISF